SLSVVASVGSISVGHEVVLPLQEEDVHAVVEVLCTLGAQLWKEGVAPPETRTRHAWVMVDGTRLHFAAEKLRAMKIRWPPGIPSTAEIVLVTRGWGKLFTGLFIFLAPGRLIRPVRQLRTQKIEWIGPMEQLFLNVSVLRDLEDFLHGTWSPSPQGRNRLRILAWLAVAGADELPEQLPLRFTHEELEPTELFSTLAALTPFSNHNQSPRNMYQCQMLKQTMATPYHNHEFRPDNKVFRIYCPQSPLVRTQMYDQVHCDEHPIGTNAVVAVITYTGVAFSPCAPVQRERLRACGARIINKQSYERGFGHGIVYKTKVLDAAAPGTHERFSVEKERTIAIQRPMGTPNLRSGCDAQRAQCKIAPDLESDGFPPIGAYLTEGCSLYCVVNCRGGHTLTKYKDDEPCYVEQATCSTHTGPGYRRNPVVGDKFSSRHGQKGVMSILWPAEDMPWSESGLTPDILFNPHGFPSRMTIGMLIESIAGKTAALEAKKTADATTFRECPRSRSEQPISHQSFFDVCLAPGPTAAEYFGQTLKKHGYKRLGTERMYSGIHGTEIETDIFIGVVYYQRLRHLVMDKAQVRSRGRLDGMSSTGEPLKTEGTH
ncbi:DNA-directed RNA polymerase I subunit RPA2 (RNA polymerase I subunit 2) (RPA135), partial [Durusdinium trenchii]